VQLLAQLLAQELEEELEEELLTVEQLEVPGLL